MKTDDRLSELLAVRWEALLARLADIAAAHPDALLASSMGVEDSLLIHALMQLPQPLGVFMLDTDMLHAETLAMVDVVRDRYGLDVQLMHPDSGAVAAYVADHGKYAFYESVALRQECCAIRKVEPLRRALAGHSAWITGQRREQSVTRAELPESQWDESFGLQKFNPLATWSTKDVWAVVRALDVPYNPLHDRGYPSIGCEPCTRAVRPGEDLRAGRWWWEQRQSRECGLHVAPAAHPHTPTVIPRNLPHSSV
ncbi:MAG: phosphoadenylyl-sulfate reductase [Castellaniella sp.]|uniref:phosphoadenylyl-sulfate reductase n=1 Tax=Castellaniella sp. TaxID=1955812 RepID=UPI00121EBDD2|nr:phosphoadenylyl-sulfate reductase [Castellaniella sp.]TAN28670.1 MAG: phosphoadenylyl-sulfate reductase [Castellaniella sp.]